MFDKILIANRGEIACRVAATAARLGIRTVAVYSDADAHAKHVAVCDEAVHVGGAAARDSYLRVEKIIEAALATGAQAIHPGYGFLSENEAFAAACKRAGLVFIGPPVEAIHAMGSKSAAKSLMEDAAVPLVPGYHGERQEPDFLQARADEIGYPVLLKASAGGGGKGMRVVERSEDFRASLASCQREAASSFGDDRVLVEKYLTRPRHIEIQVFADTHGHCVYLFERDCSVQRRHQKVLEEAPAPGMTEARRRAMGEAACNAARAVGYVGAGTVEFIVNQDGSFYFMEMNTRLQVEHPVTEMITGLDLVEWQLRVAAGEPLPLAQDALRMRGHALEARIYAENPDNNFLPSTGTLTALRTPTAVNFQVGGSSAPAAVRIDAGVREGDTISPFYDPMIAKLIVWGQDRDEALARMRQALAQYRVVGVATNIAFLGRLVASVPFAAADLDTGLIERHRDTLFPAKTPAPATALALAVAAQLARETVSARRKYQDSADQHSPWQAATGWRLNADYCRTLSFDQGDVRHDVVLSSGATGSTLTVGGETLPFAYRHDTGAYKITLGDRRAQGHVHFAHDTAHVFVDGQEWPLAWHDPLAQAGAAEGGEGRLTAPMPGKVIAVLAQAGAKVEKGAPLLVMEAMKMEHTINAPADGEIEEILFAVGDQVPEGAQLLAFKR
ncbi:3-methylcrotonyl-CoA carboxylase [Pandoraea terrae]|uniref:3-methylcrotonyl-CoA carboxylase n=1 Tax=Pandoraea terrae TaxID=1537710 RepID=A0A5E4V6Y6_9BURK|nr:acetyl/propionyl/methylcrotonyl-CoA carboxylase subunit alpha [Pandoraea terrae]VVE08082.1 3-methylcrotonyl-CoA carboxylase [Pandoraea terrae]